MNRRPARTAVGVCAFLTLLGWSPLPADDVAAALPEQIVILNNMQLLKGRVSRSPNGFVLEHAAGRLVVPNDEVRVIGKDLPEAFHRLVESYPEPTAATHYHLAMWSWSHHLKEQARDQLVMALDRDPDHEAARTMLKRIDDQKAAQRRQAAAAKPKPIDPRMVNGIALPEVESLAGLSRETAAQFTRRIQPLLINKCGNAACHGPQTPTGFQLEQIRGTGSASRLHTERNLAAVLQQIDQNRVNSSPLLTVPMGTHGGLNKSLFFGPTGERQLELLKAWARSASKELNHDQQVAEQRPGARGVRPNFTKYSAEELQALEDAANDSDDQSGAQAAVRESADSDEPGDDEDTDAEDAFDPEVFNRRYHGPKAIKPTARKGKR